MRLHALAFLLTLSMTSPALAEDPAPTEAAAPTSAFSRWLHHVREIQAEQPHWITPLATVTPRLEQEWRSDFITQSTSTGHQLVNLGNNKGLEIIPFDPVEVIVNAPAFLEHNSSLPDGWSDFSALIKYRLLSANEHEGDYIVTAFMGFSFPTSLRPNGNGGMIYTPTLAAGKGFGDFDIQSTIAATLPDIPSIASTWVWNTAFQWHAIWKLWPEVEANVTRFTGGHDGGETQVFITPGFTIGRFPLIESLALTMGAGVQIAVTSFHTYDHAYILSLRLPF